MMQAINAHLAFNLIWRHKTLLKTPVHRRYLIPSTKMHHLGHLSPTQATDPFWWAKTRRIRMEKSFSSLILNFNKRTESTRSKINWEHSEIKREVLNMTTMRRNPSLTMSTWRKSLRRQNILGNRIRPKKSTLKTWAPFVSLDISATSKKYCIPKLQIECRKYN